MKSIKESVGDIFTWGSEVRGYELDVQGIVNHAHYLHYFDHARIKHLLSKGIDWEKWHHEGFDLVLFHVDMELKSPLKGNDQFYVTSQLTRSGRLRIIFEQAIYRQIDDKLVAKATNTIVCIVVNTGKPVMPNKLLSMLFN